MKLDWFLCGAICILFAFTSGENFGSTSYLHAALSGKPSATISSHQETLARTKVLVLDVDGTLYPTAGHNDDVEMQLRNNGYSFFLRYLGMNSTFCDTLYSQYGSILPSVPKSLLTKFYREVYDTVSLYPLRQYSFGALCSQDSTGYR